eukprot:11076750-Karenia_brevis.AAC.1
MWLKTARRRKWRWARDVLNTDKERWTSIALMWCPEGTDTKAHRKPGHPKMRWSQDMVNIAGPSWQDICTNADRWDELEEKFVMQIV